MASDKRGRPGSMINWEKADQLLIAGSTGTEVAAHFGCHPNTLYRAVEEKYGRNFSEYAQQKRAKGDSLLRAAQFKNAMDGNTNMQIWLGKQRLDQRDKPKDEDQEDVATKLANALNKFIEQKEVKDE